MDQTHRFTRQRAIARHCSALIGPKVKEPDFATGLGNFGRRMSMQMPGLLKPICDNVSFAASAEPLRIGEPNATIGIDKPSFSHIVHARDVEQDDIVISIERRAVFELLNRAFGGTGKLRGPLPETMPMSARKILVRMEQAIASAITRLAPGNALATLREGRREEDVSMLRPFAAEGKVYQVPLSVSCERSEPWSVLVTMSEEIAELFCETSSERHVRSQQKVLTAEDEPFADIPMRLSAKLIDMQFPLSRLSGLKPGDVIPVSVARRVPVCIGGTVIAHGSVGDVDDCVAIRITRAFRNSTKDPLP